LVAVLFYFNKEIYNFSKNKNLFYKVIIASIPIFIIGYILIELKIISNLRTHSKTIDAGSGYLCQMEPVAHYGIRKNERNIKFIATKNNNLFPLIIFLLWILSLVKL